MKPIKDMTNDEKLSELRYYADSKLNIAGDLIIKIGHYFSEWIDADDVLERDRLLRAKALRDASGLMLDATDADILECMADELERSVS